MVRVVVEERRLIKVLKRHAKLDIAGRETCLAKRARESDMNEDNNERMIAFTKVRGHDELSARRPHTTIWQNLRDGWGK